MKKNRNKTTREKGTIAVFQILILVIATIAFSWMIGSEIEVVSAEGTGVDCATNKLGTCVTTGSCTGTIVASDCATGKTCCVTKTTETSTSTNKVKETAKTIVTDVVSTVTTQQLTEKLKEVGIGKKTSELTSATKLASAPNAGKVSKFKLLVQSSSFKQLLANVAWATATYLIINLFAKNYASERNAGDISIVSGIGAIVGVIAVELAGGPIGWVAAVITIAFTAVYMVVGYQLYTREVFTFKVGLWQPATGGSECNKCNSLEIAGENVCSEYVCHSYGAACEWVNNATEYETCIEVNVGDSASPIITPVKEIYGSNVFPTNDYDYLTSSAGSKIIYNKDTNKCVPAFSSIKLAFKTDESANCRISLEIGNDFTNMLTLAEGTSFTKNHTLTLPSIVSASESALATAGYTLTNDGNYKFYIKCEDVQGNINSVDYMMAFCVQSGPDTNPPEITGTNPATDSYISYGLRNISNFQVYTNEPADCKWDFQSKNYKYMNYNFSSCSQTINEPLSGYNLGCETDLTGFKSGVENKYYIACIDQPELKGTEDERNRNEGDAYELVLQGTEQLIVQDVKINDKENGTTISDSTDYINVKLEVTTIGGAENGEAKCKYGTDGKTYSLFNNNNDRNYLTTNTQNLYLQNGSYTYYLYCYDISGNTAESIVKFSVETDTASPSVVRVYKEEESDSLKLLTNEAGRCVYSITGSANPCSYLFNDGIEMSSTKDKEYTIEWDTNRVLYIKCEDKYENQPDPNECSIIIRPFDIVEAE